MSNYEIRSTIESFVKNPFNYSFEADLNLWDKKTGELLQTVKNIAYDRIAKAMRVYEEAGYEVSIDTYNIYNAEINYSERYHYSMYTEEEINMLYTVLTALQIARA